MKTTTRFLVGALLAFTLVPGVAHAVGETGGRIRGIISEAGTKTRIPGATVTVRGKNLIGGPQTQFSDTDGSYEFENLPPGTYDVDVEFSGVKPITRRVVVRLGETTPLDVAWSVELAKENVNIVVEERHMTRPDSTETGTVLGADTEARLATGRSYQSVLTQVAGVSDPAGRGIPNIKGANRLQNRYLVDGMDVTDSVTNNFSSQVNFDAINSVEIITGGMEAQYNSLGGVINLNTAAGTDQLHIDTSFYFNNDAFSFGTQQTGQQVYEHERPFSVDPAPSFANYQANLNVSGPLIKRRLWASVSLEYDYKESQIPIGPPINLQHPAQKQHNFFPRLKLTWAPNTRHRITLSANGDPAIVYNRSQTNSGLPITEYGQTQGGTFTVLQWDYFHSQHLSTNVQTGFNFNHVYQLPMGQFLGGIDDYGPRDPRFSDKNYHYDPNQPRHNNGSDQSSWYQGTQINKDRRYTVQFDPSLSLRGKWFGDHDAKVGLQTRYVYHHFNQHTPGGTTYNETPPFGPQYGGEAGLCDPATGMNCAGTLRVDTPDFENHQYGVGVGGFIQDRWRPVRRLMILPGIRLDYGITQNSLGQTVSNMFGVGPRLGFTYDVTGDQKTIVSAYYGRANDTLNLLPASRADVDAPTMRYRWDPTQNGGKGAFAFDSSSGGIGGYRLDPKAGPPHTDEISAGLLREFFKNSVVGVNYTYKKISNIWDAVEVNQVWDAAGGRVVGYVNGQATKIYRYTTPDGNYRNYHGVDFTLESRPTPHLDVYAAYTLSWLYGPGSDEVFTVGTGGSSYYNPRQYKFYDGYLPEDQRHQLKLHASYDWNGLVVGANLAYASGFPLTKLFYNQSDGTQSNKHTPQGTDPGANPYDPHAVAAFRNPSVLTLDVRVSNDFYALLHQHVIVIVDLFNVFNTDTPTALENRDGAFYATANKGRISPFRFQVGLRYLY